MFSIVSNSTQVFTDQISSGSMAVPLTSLVKKALAVITINGLLTSKMYTAAFSLPTAAWCAVICAFNLPDMPRYLDCLGRCMAGG
jgi:hypothetical protein